MLIMCGNTATQSINAFKKKKKETLVIYKNNCPLARSEFDILDVNHICTSLGADWKRV